MGNTSNCSLNLRWRFLNSALFANKALILGNGDFSAEYYSRKGWSDTWITNITWMWQ